MMGQAHGNGASGLSTEVRNGHRARSGAMRTPALAAMACLLSLGAVAPGRAQEAPVGRWATPGLAAIVELAPCPQAARPQAARPQAVPTTSTLCGTIRWLWDAVDEKGRPRLDVENADASLRSRPLLGLSILSGLA